ncbi:MAG: hypothetical protein GXX85_09570 [Ignavibacteria bacterium]|nr:hypothetical protein [Ignavibacteria bacterium]
MIELNIPLNAAILLLMERMQGEFDIRVRKGNYPGLQITDLDNHDFNNLAEVAAFDLVFMLPAEIFEEENNLSEVIVKALKGVSEKYGKKMFEEYTEYNAAKLISPIKTLFHYSNTKKSHLYN